MKYTSSSTICWALLVALPLLVYGQTLAYPFVWDDGPIHLEENIHLSQVSLHSLAHFWTAPFHGLYVPVAYTTWGLLKTLGELISGEPGTFNPFIFHLANVLVHILCGALVFRLLGRLVPSRFAALGGTLFFLLHPVQVEAVAWVSEFRGLLSALFVLAALNLYLDGRQREQDRTGDTSLLFGGVSILYLFALLSKPSAVVFPLFAVILDLYVFKSARGMRMARRILLWLLIIVPIVLITKSVQSKTSAAMDVPIWTRPLIWFDAINFYLYKIVNPTSLAAAYGRTPVHVIGLWWTKVAWVIPVGIGYLGWRFRKTVPALGVSFAWFIAGFLPVSGLVNFGFQDWSTVADRYIYLSMVGISLGLTCLLARINRRGMGLVFAVYLAIIGYRSADFQVPVWRDRMALWDHSIKTVPWVAQPYVNRAKAFIDLEQYAKALTDSDRAISLNPTMSKAYVNRARVFIDQKQYDAALLDLKKSIALSPKFATAHNNLGVVYVEKGDYRRAIEAYTVALTLKANYADAYYNRSKVFVHRKNYDRALADLDRAIAIDRYFAKAYNNRGSVWTTLKNYPKALADFTRAIELEPDQAEYYYNRGNLFLDLKKVHQAIADYDEAIATDTQLAETYTNRAMAHYYLKQYKQSSEDAKTADSLGQTLDPAFLKALEDALKL
jgi:tetratricopeptide (TPR) repeat protein